MGDQHSLKNGTQPTSTRQASTPSTPGPAPAQRSRPRRAAEGREAAAFVGDKLRESASSPSFKSQFYTSLLVGIEIGGPVFPSEMSLAAARVVEAVEAV